MPIRYHQFATAAAAADKLAALRAAGGIAYMLTMAAGRHEVRELHAPTDRKSDSWTLDPLSDAHLILDARNVDRHDR